MLGIIIGIFSVVLVMSIGAGAQGIILDQVERRGPTQIVILPGASDSAGPPAQALGIIITSLTDEDRDALLDKDNVTHLADLTGYILGNGILSWQGDEQSATFTGASASYERVERIDITEGIFFTEEDEKAREKVIVLGSNLREDIFGNQDAVGQRLKLDGIQFRVIGVMAAKGASPIEDVDNAAIIPLSVVQRDLLGVRHVSFMRGDVSDARFIDQTVEEIRSTLIERHGEEDFSVRNIADALEIIRTITDALKFFLVGIAAISLFVGGVGVMNIMLIAVREKTREIGLRKAVGATRSDILFQFLAETFVITIIGTFVGFLLGSALAYAIALGVQSLGYAYPFAISMAGALVSFVIALIIALIFGIVPASRASDLNPIDALRYE